MENITQSRAMILFKDISNESESEMEKIGFLTALSVRRLLIIQCFKNNQTILGTSKKQTGSTSYRELNMKS